MTTFLLHVAKVNKPFNMYVNIKTVHARLVGSTWTPGSGGLNTRNSHLHLTVCVNEKIKPQVLLLDSEIKPVKVSRMSKRVHVALLFYSSAHISECVVDDNFYWTAN